MKNETEEKRVSHVISQLDLLEKDLSILADSLAHLKDRLSSVLRETVTPAGEECKDVERLVPLAAKIRSNGTVVKSMIEEVTLILEHIEL